MKLRLKCPHCRAPIDDSLRHGVRRRFVCGTTERKRDGGGIAQTVICEHAARLLNRARRFEKAALKLHAALKVHGGEFGRAKFSSIVSGRVK